MIDYLEANFYKETEDLGYPYRKAYVDSIHRFIKKSHAKATQTREKLYSSEEFLENQEKYREKYLEMLGIPKKQEGYPKVKKEYVGQDELCLIYRLSIETMEDFFFYGMLFLPHGANNAPLVIAQHGGGGSPEFCSDMLGENNYKFFTKRALLHGIAVFAPQILVWGFGGNTGEKLPDYKIDYNRARIDSDLKMVGESITGLEIFNIMRSLDYLCGLPEINPHKIGMMGVSYGGFFSLYTAAADPRIKAVYSGAAFNDKTQVNFIDWTWKNSAHSFLDAEVAALCIPRKVVIDVGREDKVFDYAPSQSEAKRAQLYYKNAGATSSFVYNLWDGGHTFDAESNGFECFFKSVLEA